MYIIFPSTTTTTTTTTIIISSSNFHYNIKRIEYFDTVNENVY